MPTCSAVPVIISWVGLYKLTGDALMAAGKHCEASPSTVTVDVTVVYMVAL